MSFSKFVSLPGHNIQITAKSCLQVVLPITGGKFTLSTHICLMAWGTVAKLLIISAHLPCVPSWMRRQHAPKGSTTGNCQNCRTRKRMHGKHCIRWNPLKSKTTNLHRWPTCDHVSCFIRAILQEKRWRLLNREVLLLSKFLQLIPKLFGMCQQFVARDLALLKAVSLAQSLICSDVNLVSNWSQNFQYTNQAFLIVSRMVSMSSFTGWNSAWQRRHGQKTSLEGLTMFASCHLKGNFVSWLMPCRPTNLGLEVRLGCIVRQLERKHLAVDPSCKKKHMEISWNPKQLFSADRRDRIPIFVLRPLRPPGAAQSRHWVLTAVLAAAITNASDWPCHWSNVEGKILK